MGESVREEGGGGRQRGRIEDGKKKEKKSVGPAVSYSKRLCGVAIFFFSFSLALLWGDFLFLSLSLSVSPFLLSFFFYFILWCSLFFFFTFVSSGAVVLFYRAKFVEPGLCLSLSRSHLLAVCISLLYFSLLLFLLSLRLFHSHPHFHWLPSPKPVSLINFASHLLYSLFLSCISIPLINSQRSVSPSLVYPSSFLLSCVFCHLFSPQLVKNGVRTWSFWCFWALESMAWLFFVLLLAAIRPCVSQMTAALCQLNLKSSLCVKTIFFCLQVLFF